MENLITTQDFIDDAIVDEKRANKDYTIFVSPEFELDGKKMRVLIDGHHSLAAALADGVEPDVVEYDASDYDPIYLLENKGPEEFLDAIQERDWRWAVSGYRVW